MTMASLRVLGSVTCIVALGACSTGSAPQTRVVRSFLEARQDKVVMQHWDLSCGAAALATLLTYGQDDPVTERDVAAELLRHTTMQQVQRQLGFSLLDLKQYAEGHGFHADGYGNLTVKDLEDLQPAIVPIRVRGFNHFVVFRGIMGSEVLLADPAFGNRTMPVSGFQEMWQGNLAFAISRPPDLGPARNQLAAAATDFWTTTVPLSAGSPVVAPVPQAPTGSLLASAAPARLADEPISAVAAGSSYRMPVTGFAEPAGPYAPPDTTEAESAQATAALAHAVSARFGLGDVGLRPRPTAIPVSSRATTQQNQPAQADDGPPAAGHHRDPIVDLITRIGAILSH